MFLLESRKFAKILTPTSPITLQLKSRNFHCSADLDKNTHNNAMRYGNNITQGNRIVLSLKTDETKLMSLLLPSNRHCR